MREILPDWALANVLGRIPVSAHATEACRILLTHDAALRAENERLREQIALLVWASPEHKVTLWPSMAVLFPIPWELVTCKDMRAGQR